MKTVANIGLLYLVRYFIILKVSKIVLKKKNKFTPMHKWNTEWREKQRPKWNREKPWGSRIAHSFSETWGKKEASQVALVVKNPPNNAGDVRDVGSIPASGRSPGGGHGNPLQYYCLENPMDRGAWWAMVHRITKSQTWLEWLSMH